MRYILRTCRQAPLAAVAEALVVCFAFLSTPAAARRPPHLVLIVADDLGFHDVGYHGSEINTPNIDELASSGAKLENYYVQPICSPSRSQLMSGRYQIHTGLQHELIYECQPYGLPLNVTTLAEKLRESDYATHLVGKWHLGFFKEDYLPTNRGFDSFYGYVTGNEDYYAHTHCYESCGLDLHDNLTNVFSANGTYSAFLYTQRAEQLIKEHDPGRPLFLYLAFQNVHAPLQVPKRFEEPYEFIEDANRRTYAGMVAALDEAIGNVTRALRDAGLWDNTLLVFSTDNGGETREGGNNWPLRGRKWTYWEGGLRGVAFVSGPVLTRTGVTVEDLVHISDWYPTFVTLAGGSHDLEIDGIDQWSMLSEGATGLRTELLHNIDPLYPANGVPLYNDTFNTSRLAAIRVGNWKLLTGDPGWSGWVPPPSAGLASSNRNASAYGDWSIDDDENPRPSAFPADKHVKNVWLYNITADPTEKNDLSDTFPDVVRGMLDRLRFYESTAVPVWYPPLDPQCDPKYHGGVWGPWE